jgi:outer membrane protein TolC
MKLRITDCGLRIAAPLVALLVAAIASGAAHAVETNSVYPIDLPTALRLAGAQNLDVLIAREKLREAQGNHEQARQRFFPWVSPAIGYRRHDGNVQDIAGDIFTASKQAYTLGLNLNAQVELGDAMYATLAARKRAEAANEAAEAKRQDAIAAAAAGYFELAKAEAGIAVARESVRIADDYAAQVKRAVDAGIAFKGDAFRADVQKQRNEIALRRALENRSLASARLAQTLRLNPATELVPADANLAPIDLNPQTEALDSLVTRALHARPELRQYALLQESAVAEVKGANRGPWIPTIGAFATVGGLGGGKNDDWGNFGSFGDYGLGVSWRVGPGGLFDRGRQRSADARAEGLLLEAKKQADDVTRQVVDAHTRAASLRDQLATAKQALENAEQLLKLSQERKEFGVGAVLETVQAEQELTRARLDYLTLVAALNTAQYELQRVVGAIDPAAK